MTAVVLAFLAGALALVLVDRARWALWPWAGHPFGVGEGPATVAPDARTWVAPEGRTFRADLGTCAVCRQRETAHVWRCAECDAVCSRLPCDCGREHGSLPGACPNGHTESGVPVWLYCPPRPPLPGELDDG